MRSTTVPVPDIVSVASSPDVDAFTSGFTLMLGAALLGSVTIGFVNFIKRLLA